MNELNAKDLMVGDWVYRVDFKEPIPVCILGLEVVNYDTHPKQYVADVFCPKHNNNVGLYMDEICPIPLTAEILEKNGFEREEIIQSHWISEDGRILLRNDEWLINSNNKWSVHVDNEDMQTIGYFEITYAHELQHALRMAGIDKMIEL